MINNSTYFDSIRADYDPFIESIWNILDNPTSLYVRGSSSLPKDVLVHKPWDIDLVYFSENLTSETELLVRKKVIEINCKINKLNHELPKLDVSLRVNWSKSNITTRDIYMSLAMSYSSTLIKGTEQPFLGRSFCLEDRLKVLEYTRSVIERKLYHMSRKIDKSDAETVSRCRYLAKHIIRQGNIIKYVKDNVFTRSVDSGAEVLISIVGEDKTKRLINIMGSEHLDINLVNFLVDVYQEIKFSGL